MMKYCKPLLLVLYCFLSVIFNNLYAQNEPVPLSEDNLKCASCHGSKYYSFTNPLTEETNRKRMNPFFIIDTARYVSGVHRSFSCSDCHSYDYNSYPHPSELKLEPKFSCIDCHGGDETFAKYQFDKIEEDVNNSAHRNAFGTQFKCEMCHDLHTYRPVARDEHSKIKHIVVQDNQMCLNCHNDLSKYQVLTDHNKPELLTTHSWLPNQELHFLNVRCIECHTPTDDTIMVSHRILPKDQAVHLCSDCHSTNSILRDKLYKYAAQQSRSDNGYYNSVILNEAYVIGANRNKYLNIISLLFFGAALLGISIHIIFRIIKKK
ncbi:MAG: cytochrome c3 family protein [Salinivirgaceae bacterium]|nr:cytochrome c3 family protein [Salinivirgaceae bacterium]